MLRAAFPAGTVSGAPKVRAMEIIDELEPTRRGIYAGAVGYLGFQDDMDMAIAMRTAVVKDGMLYVQAGGGIVADSVAAKANGRRRRTRRARCCAPRTWCSWASMRRARTHAADDRQLRFVHLQPGRSIWASWARTCTSIATTRSRWSRSRHGSRSSIVISPGPCTPNEAGISVALIERFAGKMPILGVCLGHQAIGQAFGGSIVRAQRVMHGKVSTITHDGDGVFAGLPNPLTATRYHSLAIERESLPACLEVTATSDDGEIMGVRHRELAVEGVQFHPESILTEHGHALLRNFLDCALNDADGAIDAIDMQQALQRTIEHREIFHDEMLALMRQIMSGEVSPVLIAALTVGPAREEGNRSARSPPRRR